MGKVLLPMELILLALSSIPALLTGDIRVSRVQRETFLPALEAPRWVCSPPWCGGHQSYHKLCSFRERIPALQEGQGGLCLPWDGHRAPATPTLLAGEQRGLHILQTHQPGGLGEPFPAL